MCGICGLAGSDPHGAVLDAPTLRTMTSAIVHRGPDEEGHHLGPGVALGMRRLSIIDLGGSRQPVANEDGSIITVFNGEIFNYPELRALLLERGHVLRTQGDTETIVHLYEDHGLGFVEHLRGMFGLAIWDERRRRLVLARDRMGVKPLYVAHGPDGLAFASEVKALIAGGLVTPALDPVGAELFLAHGFVPGSATLFAGVRKLAPAALLVYEDGVLTEERSYWTPWDAGPPAGVAGGPAPRSWDEDAAELLALLDEATRARMISDVPLGSMLSGGLDSSLITALMARHSSQPVKTFSIGFVEDGDANELPDARRVARRLGTDHHELLTSATEHPGLLDDALWHLEDPVADISFLGFLLLSRLARQHVTVALSGQGADELLGGYRKHEIASYAALAARLPRPVRRAGAGGAQRVLPTGSTVQRGAIAVLADDPVQRLLASSRVFGADERGALLAPGFAVSDAEHRIGDVVRAQLPPLDLAPLGTTLHLDARLALADSLLLYFDKMSMAASLEARVPFMDHDVVSFCARLPDSRKVWRRRRKELLRRASRGLVDDAVIDKPKRAFFRAGLSAWLRVHSDALVAETLAPAQLRGRGQFEPAAVQALIRAAGRGGIKDSQRLMCVLLLERWQRVFVDGEHPASAQAVEASIS